MGQVVEKRFRAWDTVKIGTDYEEKDHPIHGPSLFYKDVVIAREIVQEYDDGRAWKPADELEKAAPYAGPRWAVSARHPETGLLMDTEDIHGLFENPRFVKNLKDHGQTGRESVRGIMGDLWAFLKYIAPNTVKEMRNGKRQDVSIGFVFTMDENPGTVPEGPLKGESFDYAQRDIFLDHLTFGINSGRCPMPYCGLTADSKIPPTVTENANRILAKTIDRGNMPEVKEDLSLTEINKIIKELKDKLEEKRKEINSLYIKVEALFDEAEEKSRPIYNQIDNVWAEWDEIYDDLLAYREAKILLLTKSALGESIPQETDEEKATRTMAHFGFTVEEWDQQPDNLRAILLDKAPPVQKDPSLDKTRELLLNILVGEDNEKIKAILDTMITLNEESAPELAKDIIRKLTKAQICWSCLDTFIYDYNKAPEDDPWDYDESKYTPEQLSYACSYIKIDSEIHNFGYTGEDLTKEACNLPHHLPGDGESHGGTLVWHGVSAAGAAIMGARGASISGEAADKAKTHLAKHYKEFDKTPPWEEEEDQATAEDLVISVTAEVERSKQLLGDNPLKIAPAKDK